MNNQNDFNMNINQAPQMNYTPPTMQGVGLQGPTQAAEPVDFTNFLQHANHPGIVFFTLFFKTLSVVR